MANEFAILVVDVITEDSTVDVTAYLFVTASNST